MRGVNMVKRHQKQTAAPGRRHHLQGGADPPVQHRAIVGKDGKPTRVGFKIQADGKKVRVAKRSGAEIDG